MQWSDRIGRRVKLRDLHVFLAVAQCGSMAKAAERLAVSQPVVSKTIADLEHALGVRLLDRTFHGAEPTAYGRAVIDCGTAVFDDLRRGVQQLEFLSDPTTGDLRVGAATPLTEDLVPAVVERLTMRNPRITCQIAEGDSPALSRMLRERKLDLVVARTWGLRLGDEFDAESVFNETLSVVAGVDSPWARRRKVDFAALAGEPWVLPESIAGVLLRDIFGRARLSLPLPRVVSNSMAVRIRLVEGGRFLTLLPASMLHFGARRLKVRALRVSLPFESEPVGIITLRDRTANPIASLFRDELHALIGELGLAA